MMHVALYEPEIPPNTGNIIRLCANTNTPLHLIEPLGFEIDDKRLRRAGLDYSEYASTKIYKNYNEFTDELAQGFTKPRIFACSTKGSQYYTDVKFQSGDILLFGPETRGLPKEVRESLPAEQVIKIPMAAHSRSLNLSNACAIILYEALRQQGFPFL